MSAPTVHREDRDGIALLELDHWESRNSLSADMRAQLHQALGQIALDSQVRCVVLAGRGGTFCSGMDLAEMSEDAPGTTAQLQPLCDAFMALPQPVVAAIEGHCLGGGLQLALSCDFRISLRSAQFGIPATRIGIIYPPEAVDRLIAVAGWSWATQLLLSAQPIDGEQARTIGIVQHLADAPLLENAWTLARSLVSKSPHSLSASKQLLLAATRGGAAGSTVADRVARASNPDLPIGLSAMARRSVPAFDNRIHDFSTDAFGPIADLDLKERS